MRTKTLLLSAAALVAGIATSQAQVYSQNVVGYATISITPGSSLNLIAPALDVDGTGTNGTIQTVLGTNCAIGSTVYIWNGVGFDTLEYNQDGPRGGPYVNEWDLGITPDSTYPLNVGEGFWIIDPSDTSITVVGDVLQGALVNKYLSAPSVLNLVSDQVPLSGGLTSVLGYSPTIGDTVYLWNGTGFNTYEYNQDGPRGGPYTDEWDLGITPSEPQISVGQGFWIIPASGTPSWNQTFTVN